jgi:hypothetical protein
MVGCFSQALCWQRFRGFLPWDFSLLTPLVLQLTFLIQIFFFLFFSRTIEKFSMEKIERGQFVDFNDKNSQIPSQSNFFFWWKRTNEMFLDFQVARKNRLELEEFCFLVWFCVFWTIFEDFFWADKLVILKL